VKIFLDTANLDEIERAERTGLLDGVTTNPTLISREPLPFDQQVRKITEITDGPVCLEVTSQQAEQMVAEGQRLAKLAKQALIKIPAGSQGAAAVSRLSKMKIPTVATLCFSANQALAMAKAGAAYAAVFIGRIDDTGGDGMEVVEQVKRIYENYDLAAKIIVASVRSPLHVRDAALVGADVVTMPYKVFEMLTKHPLTDAGLEKFMADWEEFKKRL
jgi:transaldolase